MYYFNKSQHSIAQVKNSKLISINKDLITAGLVSSVM